MIIKAASEQEAIEKAVKKGIKKENIIEVITLKSPSKNIFGKLKDPGNYEIILSKISQDNSPGSIMSNSDDNSEPNLSEYIEIINGKVIVSNPQNNDNTPILYNRDPNVDIYVNSEKLISSMVLHDNDDIHFVYHNIEPTSKISAVMSVDKMEVKMSTTIEKGKQFYLKDVSRGSKVEVKLDFNLIDPPQITKEQCLEVLQNYGIFNEFINIQLIDELINCPESSSKIVAMGKPMIQSKKTQIRYSPYLFQDISEGIEPIVEVGEVLAEKLSKAVPGTDGINLVGGIIKASKVEDIPLKAGEEAILNEKEDIITSHIKGRPYFKNGVVSVVPLFQVNGDYSNQMGNVNFKGDIIVNGNVLDEVSFIATGSILIKGSVYNSALTANNSINISGKVISSTIQAGADTSKSYLIIPHLEEINEIILSIFQEIKNSNGNNSDKLNIIYPYKESIENTIKKIIKVTELMDKKESLVIMSLINDLRNGLMLVSMLKDEGFKILLTFYNEVVKYIGEIAQLSDNSITVKIAYAQNSQINSCGDIIITGKGSYQSNLIAQNKITYERMDSVVKGGTLIAGREIKAGTVGTSNEIYTECRVLKSDGQIKGRFHRGSLVIINNVKQDIETID